MEIMMVNQHKYQVIKLLGKGKGGYSYLVSDGSRQYTLKQIHHEPCDYYQFSNKLESELRDYKRLKEIEIPLPELLDVDIEHERILKEYIEGETIMDLVEKNLMKETYFDQIHEMCMKLYPNGLNIDYYPTNNIDRNDQLIYIDYECNEYSEKWNFENWGSQYWEKKTS